MQQRLGIDDSPELMYADMIRAGQGLNHPDLVHTVASRSAEVVQWSMSYLGVEYLDRIDQFGGHSVPRCLTALDVSGSTIIRRQLEKLRELGVPVKLRSHFLRFARNESGRVCGVVVLEGVDQRYPEAGVERRIGARKAVVLATGGFGADVAFRSMQDPRLGPDVDTTNKPFATAEALVEALRIGAMPVHLSHIQLGPWASPDEKGYGVGPRFADYVVFQYGVVLNPGTGRRFVNELADRKTVADAILAVGKPCVGIADRHAVSRSGWSIKHCLEKGVVREFGRVADLAMYYGMPPAAVEEAVARFSAQVVSQVDRDFGKPILAGAAPLAHPPFYGMRLWPKVHHTMGGIGIDVNASVLDLDGHRIPGLYAAGEVTGGIHGACRLGSCAITECLVFGRIAGHSAAEATA
jgi:flavocytochrome c